MRWDYSLHPKETLLQKVALVRNRLANPVQLAGAIGKKSNGKQQRPGSSRTRATSATCLGSKSTNGSCRFPSYLFVRIIERWYPVNNTIGVVNLLLAGDQPAKLKDEIVSDIRSKERGGIVRLPPKPGLKVGQQVRILRGSFENHVGVYDGMTGRERERVLLELLGRKVPVEFKKTDIAPVPAGAQARETRSGRLNTTLGYRRG